MAILALAAWLRLQNLAGPSLWDDEMHTIDFSQRPLNTILRQSAQKDSNPLGFYLLLHYWLPHGDGEMFFRVWPVLFGILSVLALYWLGINLSNRKTALMAALLMAVHPLAIYSSREVRAHSATLLLLILATAFLTRLLARGRFRDAAGYALCLGAALHFHYYSFFVCGGQFLILGWLMGREIRHVGKDLNPTLRLAAFAAGQQNFSTQQYGSLLTAGAVDAHRRFFRGLLLGLAAQIVALVLFLPFFKIFAFQLLRGQPWRPPLSPMAAVAKSWLYLAYAAVPDRLPTFWLPESFSTDAFRLLSILGLVSLPVLFAIIFGLVKNDWPGTRTFPLALFLAPFVLLFVVLFFQPLFDARHVLLFMPVGLILMAHGVSQVSRKSRAAAFLLSALILAPMLLSLYQARTDPDYGAQDWRGAARTVCQERKPGDLVLSYHPEKSYSFQYYTRSCGLKVEHLFDDQVFAMDLNQRRVQVMKRLLELTTRVPSLWLVEYHSAVYDPVGEVRAQLLRDGFYHIRRLAYDRGIKRFMIDRYTRNQTEAAAAYASEINLTGAYNPGQLLDGWYPPGEKGAWTGQTAAAVLLRTGQNQIETVVYLHRPFYDGPVTVGLYVEDRLVEQRTFDNSILATLGGSLPNGTPNRGLIQVRLRVDRTFIPARVMNTSDQTHKGLLVQRLSLK